MQRIGTRRYTALCLLTGTLVHCSTGSEPVHTESIATGSTTEDQKKGDAKPNILLIVADDLGFSDVGALGGEIATPNLDALVGDGRLLVNHHSATVSAITRAMLMSGTDSHLVGLGAMDLPTF